MAQNLFRIAADVPADARKALIAKFAPRFENVFCQSITLAYKVTDQFVFEGSPVTCEVYAVHRGLTHECLLVRMGGQTMRPDGKPFHITLSTMKGVEPAQAGTGIVRADIQLLDLGQTFQTLFKRFPLWQQTPSKNQALVTAA